MSSLLRLPRQPVLKMPLLSAFIPSRKNNCNSSSCFSLKTIHSSSADLTIHLRTIRNLVVTIFPALCDCHCAGLRHLEMVTSKSARTVFLSKKSISPAAA